MKKQQPFNFEKQLRLLLPHIKIEDQEMEHNKTDQGRTVKSLKQEVVKLQKEEEHIFKQQSTCMAQTESSDCLLYAFCQSTAIDSQITLFLVKKSNGKSSKVHLKSIKVEVLLMKFTSSSQGQIHLLTATSCGRLFIYADFELKHVSVTALKISSAEIVDLLVPSFPDCIFVLSANNIIYFINFSLKSVLCQFQCQIPLIQDRNSKLIIDHSQLYIGHVFSYGRIILWEISQELKLRYSINIDTSISTSRSHDYKQQPNPKSALSNKGKQIQKKRLKQIILKPKMSLMGMLVDGILWVDFLGQFLIIITTTGFLRVVAINVNDFNQNQQFYTIISQLLLCRETFNGKNIESEKIVHVVNLADKKCLLIGKQIAMEQSRKKISSSQIIIEKYLLDKDFRVFKLFTIQPMQTNFMREFQLSHCGRFLIVSSDHQFTIIMSLHLFS